jgi:hypothetical protein
MTFDAFAVTREQTLAWYVCEYAPNLDPTMESHQRVDLRKRPADTVQAV